MGCCEPFGGVEIAFAKVSSFSFIVMARPLFVWIGGMILSFLSFRVLHSLCRAFVSLAIFVSILFHLSFLYSRISMFILCVYRFASSFVFASLVCS